MHSWGHELQLGMAVLADDKRQGLIQTHMWMQRILYPYTHLWLPVPHPHIWAFIQEWKLMTVVRLVACSTMVVDSL